MVKAEVKWVSALEMIVQFYNIRMLSLMVHLHLISQVTNFCLSHSLLGCDLDCDLLPSDFMSARNYDWALTLAKDLLDIWTIVVRLYELFVERIEFIYLERTSCIIKHSNPILLSLSIIKEELIISWDSSNVFQLVVNYWVTEIRTSNVEFDWIYFLIFTLIWGTSKITFDLSLFFDIFGNLS